ncbi:MAG: UvrD-helicase domain-containing protein, partial [Oligoflexia bacterium]|nr:UvrD-helicase domain-containing protein [Oligoflexia bacterium]
MKQQFEQSKNASEEQKPAIKHVNGALLEAGAGSGKTFVIIEHIIDKINLFLNENINILRLKNNSNEFLLKLRIFLSEIVVTTFTRKAAEELSIRLKNRIEKMIITQYDIDETLHREMWKYVMESFACLNVSTIHSFCFTLIKNGTFLNLNPASKVISEIQGKKRIENILKKWIDNNQNENSLLIENLLLHFTSIVESFYLIFNDPNLRKMWPKIEAEKIFETNLCEFTKELKKHSPFRNAFETHLDLENDYSQFKKLKWFQLLQQFEKIRTSENFNDFYALFSNINRLPPKPNEHQSTEEIIKYWSGIKALKDFIKNKDNLESFNLYYKEYSSNFMNWAQTIKKIIDYLEFNYFTLSDTGMTFSDLEYYVLSGMENDTVRKRVSSLINYFIIDEFQDVSNAQFDLIEKVIDSKFERLFGVGDIKQAIYGFRGGELEVFLKCQKLVNKVYSLKDNYRSIEEIVSFNNEFFSYIFKKGQKFRGEEDILITVTKQSSKHNGSCKICQQVEENDVVINKSNNDNGGIFKCNTIINFINKSRELEPGENANSNSKPKLKNKDVDILEAKVIALYIKKLDYENNPYKRPLSVLYKNLNPVKYLISFLIEEDISFQAQIKIPYKDDPIIGIFT